MANTITPDSHEAAVVKETLLSLQAHQAILEHENNGLRTIRHATDRRMENEREIEEEKRNRLRTKELKAEAKLVAEEQARMKREERVKEKERKKKEKAAKAAQVIKDCEARSALKAIQTSQSKNLAIVTISIVRREVKGQSSKDVKKLQRSLHHIAAQNTLLRGEVRGLRQSLAIKERRNNKSFTLQLDDDPEYHGGAVWWSPKSVKQAEQAESNKAARLCKLRLQAKKRVERERRQEEKRKKDAAKLAKKQHRELINNTKKLIQLPQKGKRKASKAHKPATKRQKRVGVAPAVLPERSPLQFQIAA
ncbi:pogo transposable [Stemphylium lycopersici]|uniref:Pogo transposable n=1 Tax=Stemphylium lycopersici TaxID=183478 RepID=A0A364MRA6_STELY|nr:pogo transposable [Stemphylium lycopersici]